MNDADEERQLVDAIQVQYGDVQSVVLGGQRLFYVHVEMALGYISATIRLAFERRPSHPEVIATLRANIGLYAKKAMAEGGPDASTDAQADHDEAQQSTADTKADQKKEDREE